MPEDRNVIFTNRLSIMPDTAGSGPAKSATKADWVSYAVASGVEPAEARSMSRDELIEELGTDD